MPYVRVETNVELKESEKFISELSEFTAKVLGKPESYVLISVHERVKMSFGGSTDPAALLTMKSLGLQAGQCAALSERLCAFMEKESGIPANRIYIEFADHERSMFGWNSGTFG